MDGKFKEFVGAAVDSKNVYIFDTDNGIAVKVAASTAVPTPGGTTGGATTVVRVRARRPGPQRTVSPPSRSPATRPGLVVDAADSVYIAVPDNNEAQGSPARY